MIKKIRKINAGSSLLNHASVGKSVSSCKLEIDNRLYSDGLIKQVWLRENTTKEESHKLSKEAKAGICYLNHA